MTAPKVAEQDSTILDYKEKPVPSVAEQDPAILDFKEMPGQG